MNRGTTAQMIHARLVEAQKSGKQSVEIEPLLKYIESLDVPLDPEGRRLQHQSDLAHYNAQRDIDLEAFRAQQEMERGREIEYFRAALMTGKTALTACMLLNGGATVALLAFLGNLSSKWATTSGTLQAQLVFPLIAFAAGAFAGAVATGATYVGQFLYSQGCKRWGIGFHVFTIAVVLGAYAAFLLGIRGAYLAFLYA